MPPGRRVYTACAIGIAATASAFLEGCANAPSIGLLGAYFPDWLFCIIAGVVLALALFLTLKRFDHDRLLGPPAIVYPTLVTLFSLAAWLVFFQH
jgi:hypothetical protein